MNDKVESKHILQLVRERFLPLVLNCGPLHAGEITMDGITGAVYLDMLSRWLWFAKSADNGLLSDKEVGDVVSPHMLVRNLLWSVQDVLKGLVSHVDRIESSEGDTVAILRYYLENSGATIADLIATRSVLAPRSSERPQ
jgi:hypothetical protein